MQQCSQAPAILRTTAPALSLALLAALSACGGGGSSGGTPTATVTSMSVVATRYLSTATVTINGTALDSTLAVSSPACTNVALASGSTSTTATYTCTVDGALTGTIVAKSNGTQIGSTSFTVPAPVVTMTVNNGLSANGNLVITLAPDKAPKTVDNFLHYVNTGFYNNTIFHRVVANFIVQGGGYASPVTNLSTATLKTGLAAPIAIENTGLSNVALSIAMANANTSSDEVTPTTTSQFYINLVKNTQLDSGYAVFGAVTGGASVVSAIVAAPASCVGNALAGTTDCLPVPNVVITSASQTQ
jgi:peptidyl-prolyl cis-trans isomerase A (cyclophilin A)